MEGETLGTQLRQTGKLAISFTLSLALGAIPHLALCDTIVLIDLSVIVDVEITEADEDGVHLSDGRMLAWDMIHQVQTAGPLASRIADLESELAPSLRSLTVRLSTGDFDGASQIAEPLYARFRQRDGRGAYAVSVAMYHNSLDRGDREAAVEPLLQATRILFNDPALSSMFSQVAVPVLLEQQTGSAFLPIFFDEISARQSLTELTAVRGQLEDAGVQSVHVYAAALAIAAADLQQADRFIADLDQRDGDKQWARQWSGVLRAQILAHRGEFGKAVEALRRQYPSLNSGAQLVAAYEIATIALKAEDAIERRDGAIDLLSIAANHGAVHPELAAASLSNVIQSGLLADHPEALDSLTSELREKYGHTWHGRKLLESDRLSSQE